MVTNATNPTVVDASRQPAEADSLGPEPLYIGMRCTADEFLELEDDGSWYQLINGVVIMSPRPSLPHQKLLAKIGAQLDRHTELHGGEYWPEVDLRLAPDLVYSPDLVYMAPGRTSPSKKTLTLVPDLIVEIISPSSRRMDTKTKRSDYERFGVREYWMVEPAEKRVRVLRLVDGKYVEAIQTGDTAPSQVIPGFAFDLVALRKVMEA